MPPLSFFAKAASTFPKENRGLKLLQRICLFAAIPVILALCVCRTPLRFGAQADALFGTVADTYEAGEETVEVSRTSLPQGSSVLLLRGWTLGGEDRCVMGSFQTAHRTLRSRAIWSTEIADDTLSVRWFDGQIWHDEPIRTGKYHSNTAFFLTGRDFSALCYTPQVWAFRENGSRQLADNWLGWIEADQTKNGWRLTFCTPRMKGSSTADFTFLTVADSNGINWTRDGIPALWSNYRNAGDGRWCFDGYYTPSPETYIPTGNRVFFRNAASYMIKSFLYQAGSTRTARDLSIAMLDTMISEQSDDGCWPTLSGSTWLESEYGIGAGFFDTRFNTEFAGLLLLAEYRFPSDIYRDSLRRYCGFFKDFAENYHSETGLGGWFIPDYWHEDMSSVSHTSLNHQLAEILFLYRASDALADDSLSALADRMLLAVDETGEDWVLPDGNLHYQVSQDGEYGNTDYPYLTYDDLFKLQKYLSDRFSRTDPVLDLLMQHKRAWMDANGITVYMK